MSPTDSENALEMLLAKKTPAQQAKLKAAWEKCASGHPESAPAIYAMAQLFLIDAHSSIVDREAELLAEFREVCEEQRLIFQSAVSQETKVILDGFEKRQAIFEQNQQRFAENLLATEAPKKAGSLLPMVIVSVISLLGGGYAMHQYKEKQLQAERDSGHRASTSQYPK